MLKHLIPLPIAAALAFTSLANRQAIGAARDCLVKIGHLAEILPDVSRRTRDLLIKSPGQIGAIVQSAKKAAEPRRAEIELGIIRAIEYLSCVDPPGSQAIATYLDAHRDDRIVADIDKARGSQASAGAAAGNGGGAQGGDNGSFASGGQTISQH